MNFLRPSENVKISNFIGRFCLKDKLTEQKIDTGKSCPDRKELWKVPVKSKVRFQIENKKIR